MGLCVFVRVCVCKAGLMVLFSRHTPEDRAHVQNGTEDLQCVSV